MEQPKGVFGTKEWASHSINFQSGCEHDCKYCYAKEGAIKRGHNSADGWHNSRIREKAVKKGRGKLDGTIMIPTTHDITPSNVKEAIIVFKKLLKAGNNLLIVSKPHKECIQEICDVLVDYKNQILFRFTMGSTSDDVLSFWEPNAPSFKERLESLKIAYFAGYKTSVSSEPMLDGNIDRVVTAVEDYVTDSMWIGKMNRCVNRIKTNGHGDAETLRKLDSLMQFQNHKPNIMKIYDQYKHHPKVKWKESIKKVVGLEVPTEAGLDI
jgi:DNA repair photolyase